VYKRSNAHWSTGLFKQVADVLEPFLVELFNRSLSEGLVPSVFKAAYVMPLLKKAYLDSADAKSYRTISNLSVLSKLLERLWLSRLSTISEELGCCLIYSLLTGPFTLYRDYGCIECDV